MGAMEQVWARVAPVTCLHPGWTLLSGREAVLESWRTILAKRRTSPALDVVTNSLLAGQRRVGPLSTSELRRRGRRASAQS